MKIQFVSLEYKVDNYSFESAEDNDGELRILNGEIMLNIYSSGSNIVMSK